MPTVKFDPTDAQIQSRPLLGEASERDPDAAPAGTSSRTQSVAQQGFNTLAALPAVFAEETISSLSFGAVDDDFITSNIAKIAPEFGQFVKENRGALEIGSAIASVVATPLASARLFSGATRLGRAVSQSRLGRPFKRLDAAALRRQEAFQDGTLVAASQQQDRLTGIAAGVGDLGQLRTQFKNARAAQGAITAAKQEVTLAGISNQNSFLFGEDPLGEEFAENLIFAAAGVGLGALFAAIQAGSFMNRFNNSELVRRTESQAIDPAQIDQTVNDVLNGNLTISKPVEDAVLTPNGGLTDVATLQLSGATRQTALGTADDVSSSLVSAREADANERLRFVFGTAADTAAQTPVAKTQSGLIEKVTVQGIPGATDTGFRLNGNPEATRALLGIARGDPAVFAGVEQLGSLPRGTAAQQVFEDFQAELVRRRERTIAEIDARASKGKPVDKTLRTLSDADLQTELRRVNFLERDTEAFVIHRGETVPLAEFENTRVEDLEGFTGQVRRASSQPGTADVSVFRDSEFGFEVSTDGEFLFPGKLGFTDLTGKQADALHRTVRAALDSIIRRTEITSFDVPSNPSFLQLDMAEQLAREAPEIRINFPGNMTRESAAVESFAQKIEAFQALQRTPDTPTFIARRMLNLPIERTFERGASALDATPLESLLKELPDATAIRESTLNDIQGILASGKNATDLVRVESSKVDLLGNSLRASESQSAANAIDFIAIKRRPDGADFLGIQPTAERMAAQVANSRAVLLNSDTSAVSQAARLVLDTPAFRAAVNTEGLNNAQLAGTLPGLGNTQVNKSIRSTARLAVENPTLQAAQVVQNTADRIFNNTFNRLLQETQSRNGRPLVDTFRELRNRRNNPSALLLDQFISARRAWDVLDEFVPAGQTPRGDALEAVKLDPNSARNQERWRELFGEEMPRDALMPSAPIADRGAQFARPVTVDRLAREGLEALVAVSDAQLREQNVLLRAAGLPELKRSALHIPPRNFQNQVVAFVQDASGKVQQTLAAPTREQLTRIIAAETANPRSLASTKGFTIRTQEQLEGFNSIWQRAQTGLLDPNLPHVQASARGRRGGSASSNVELGAHQQALVASQRNFRRMSRDFTEIVFKNQVDAARRRSRAAGGRTVGANPLSEQRDINELFLNTLLGRLDIDSPGSVVGQGFNYLESVANRGLAKIPSKLELPNNPFRSSTREQRAFQSLVKDLGEENVLFDDAADLLEQRLNQKMPPEFRRITGKLNRVMAALTLRYDAIHAGINMVGLVNTTPAVIRTMTQQAGETKAQFRERNGAIAEIYDLSPTQSVGTLDPIKVVHRGLRNMMKASPEELKLLRDRGFITQEVAEFQRSLQALEGTDSPLSALGRNVDGILGFLTDRSEDLSRQVSQFIGMEVARINGLQNADDIATFGHELANKNIANYNPFNRPEIFQGGIGAPLGLFQSYMWNFGERMFRFIETKDARGAATQLVTQGALFGGAALPGYAAFTEIVGRTSDFTENPMDVAIERLPPGLRDVYLYGMASSLPKLFGAEEGIAVSGRGDISPRIPFVNSSFPIAQAGKQLFEGASRGLQQFSSGHPGVSLEETLQILAQASPNRPLSGLLDVIAGSPGEVDRNLALVSDDRENALTQAFRVLGVKPLGQQFAQDASFATRRREEHQRAQRAKVRNGLRSFFRTKNPPPDRFKDIFKSYLRSGGDPQAFPQFVRENLVAAGVTVTERKLFELFDDAGKDEEIIRLLNAVTR